MEWGHGVGDGGVMEGWMEGGMEGWMEVGWKLDGGLDGVFFLLKIKYYKCTL